MKVTKPSGNDLKNTAALGGGVVVGIGISKGVFALLHDEEKVALIADTAEKSKQENFGLLKHVGLAGAGYGIASAIKSNDIVSLLVKGLALGMAGQQTSEVISKLTSKNSKVAALANSTDMVAKAAAKALGLKGCGCTGHLNGARSRSGKRAGMRGVGVFSPNDSAQFAPAVEQSTSPFEAAFNQGRLLSA